MWRNIAANAMTLLVGALVVAVGMIAWAKREYHVPGPLKQAICLRVESGSKFLSVSQDLAKQGAIDSAWLFRVGADYEGKSRALKAGSFLIPENSSMQDIVGEITGSGVSTCGTEVVYRIGVTRDAIEVRQLDPTTSKFSDVATFDPTSDTPPDLYTKVRAAKDTRYRVSLAEGVTSWQVVQALKAADFMVGDIKDIPPEGMLAPQSYEVVAGSSRPDLIGRMEALQKQRLDDAWQHRADNLPLKTPEDALILASLIEKETGVPDERSTVASVFINRLRQGIRLQTDPSVIYGVTGGKGVLGRGLRQSELRRETPYNTYVVAGLPPTPIANPGLASIEAAVHPDNTDYLYFVADGTGGHAFSKTLAEHNANVAKWRALEAQRQDQAGAGN